MRTRADAGGRGAPRGGGAGAGAGGCGENFSAGGPFGGGAAGGRGSNAVLEGRGGSPRFVLASPCAAFAGRPAGEKKSPLFAVCGYPGLGEGLSGTFLPISPDRAVLTINYLVISTKCPRA